ncbi:GTP-binding protein Di-Ras2-like [Antechinus flavipes]|uniref:GTP-binding protein Di-Ras2-like n=2 Tax=Dasyuridae TaxID=9277 RepID=UPI002235F22F|nr:GTP-binding protein Di-Ras2-like [Antechinus flavipes]
MRIEEAEGGFLWRPRRHQQVNTEAEWAKLPPSQPCPTPEWRLQPASSLSLPGSPLSAQQQDSGSGGGGSCFSLPPAPNRASEMPEQSNDYRVVVFGAAGVGKSSLVLRFVRGTFRETYVPTIEDTYRQVICCEKSVCTLQITDTTGSHQFPAMQRLSISKGHAFILVYSVTSKQSLEDLLPIYEQIRQIKGDVQKVPIMLVGNKTDEDQRELQASEGEALANKWNCSFMETSAKNNSNVQELFEELLNLEKRRPVCLQVDGKKAKAPTRAARLRGKCCLM